MVEVMPTKHLSILGLELEVAAKDGHDELVHPVVYVASHGGLLGYVLDMVEHDLSTLKILARMYVLNQVNLIAEANLGHLEDQDFVHLVTLAWEVIPLDIMPGADTSKLSDAIHNS